MARGPSNRSRTLIGAAMVAVTTFGCDIGTPALSNGGKGPAPRVVWRFPASAEGVDASMVPIGATIRFQFDRFLAPFSVESAALCLELLPAMGSCVEGWTAE